MGDRQGWYTSVVRRWLCLVSTVQTDGEQPSGPTAFFIGPLDIPSRPTYGSRKRNPADCYRKQRESKGEACSMKALTILELRNLLQEKLDKAKQQRIDLLDEISLMEDTLASMERGMSQGATPVIG